MKGFDWRAVIATAGGAWLLTAHPASAASFDCAYAKSVTARLICSDPELSKYDDHVSAAYKQAFENAKGDAAIRLAKNQDVWVKRQNECTDKQCLADSYAGRLAELLRVTDAPLNAGAHSDKPPAESQPQTEDLSANTAKCSGEFSRYGFTFPEMNPYSNLGSCIDTMLSQVRGNRQWLSANQVLITMVGYTADQFPPVMIISKSNLDDGKAYRFQKVQPIQYTAVSGAIMTPQTYEATPIAP